MMLIYILIALPLVYVLRKQVRTLVTKMFKAAAPEGAPPVVTISSGQVEGELCYSGNGSRVFSSFNGIPFAKPPLGKYRFLRPQPVDKVSKCNSIRIHDKAFIFSGMEFLNVQETNPSSKSTCSERGILKKERKMGW